MYYVLPWGGQLPDGEQQADAPGQILHGGLSEEKIVVDNDAGRWLTDCNNSTDDVCWTFLLSSPLTLKSSREKVVPGQHSKAKWRRSIVNNILVIYNVIKLQLFSKNKPLRVRKAGTSSLVVE